jgi:hypothetical protein
MLVHKLFFFNSFEMDISARVAAGLKLLGSCGTITEDCFTKLLEAGVSVITDSQKMPSKHYYLTAGCFQKFTTAIILEAGRLQPVSEDL